MVLGWFIVVNGYGNLDVVFLKRSHCVCESGAVIKDSIKHFKNRLSFLSIVSKLISFKIIMFWKIKHIHKHVYVNIHVKVSIQRVTFSQNYILPNFYFPRNIGIKGLQILVCASYKNILDFLLSSNCFCRLWKYK